MTKILHSNAAPCCRSTAADETCNLVDNGAALATKTCSGALVGAGCAGIVGGSSDAHHVDPATLQAYCIHQIVVACRHRCDVRRFGSTRLNDGFAHRCGGAPSSSGTGRTRWSRRTWPSCPGSCSRLRTTSGSSPRCSRRRSSSRSRTTAPARTSVQIKTSQCLARWRGGLTG